MKHITKLIFIFSVLSLAYPQALNTHTNVDDLKEIVESAARDNFIVLVEEFTGFL